MSIFFLYIKYIILFSLLQYSTALVFKPSKYYTSLYIKKQSKTTFYHHNRYKARKNNDYNYKDWEEKKQDVYDYLLSSTNHTSTTAANIVNETSIQEMHYPGTSASPILESSQYETLDNSSATYPTLPSSDSTPDTSLPTPSTVSTPLSISTSISTPYNITTTTVTQKVSSENITIVTTTPSSTVTQDIISLYLKEEIETARVKLRAGYFTASVYVLLKIIERKEDIHVEYLLEGLNLEFNKLNALHRLAMFGPMITSVFTSMVKTMATAPIQLIKLQSKNGQELLENKNDAFKGETKAVFDVVDSIYIQEDIKNIIVPLTDIQNFPTPVPMPAIDVAEDAMVAFIFIPYARIQGLLKEEVLLRAIHNVVEKRMFGEEYMPDLRKNIETNRKTSSKDIIKLKDTKFTEAQFIKGFVEPTLFTVPTTINSSAPNYTSYVKDPKIMQRLRHKIRTQKNNFGQLRWKKRKFKTKRKVTSTVTTYITEVPQDKRKYYMRKNVKEKLYKMKITTPKAIRFTGKYYKKIRKFIYDGNFNKKKDKEKSSSDSEKYYSDNDNNNYGDDAFKSNGVKSMISIFKMKNNIIHGENSKMEIKDINKTQTSDNKTDSSDSNAEAYLQVNLNDAQIHPTNITIDRRFMKKKINKLRKIDSFSDDEAILKSNIYKVFGYSNDFAKRLRAVL